MKTRSRGGHVPPQNPPLLTWGNLFWLLIWLGNAYLGELVLAGDLIGHELVMQSRETDRLIYGVSQPQVVNQRLQQVTKGYD